MGKSIRSKIKRRYRSERREQFGKPHERKLTGDSLARLQHGLLKAQQKASLHALGTALTSGEAQTVQLVEDDVNPDTRFSFSDRSFKLKTPKFTETLQSMIERRAKESEEQARNKRKGKGKGKGKQSGSAQAEDDAAAAMAADDADEAAEVPEVRGASGIGGGPVVLGELDVTMEEPKAGRRGGKAQSLGQRHRRAQQKATAAY